MIKTFENFKPKIPQNCFIASHAIVIGDVEIGEESSIWFHAVLRGDDHSIKIGKRTNIQDLCMIHVTDKRSPRPASTTVGDEVTVGHNVVLHGCTIGSRVLVGMGSIILDGAVIGDDCVIGAGSLVTQNTIIKPGTMAFGQPAKEIRPLLEQEKIMNQLSAAHYWELAKKYLNCAHS